MSAPAAVEMTAVVQLAITEPGVYQLTDAAYHADPVPGGSLSVSGARKLLPPSCPARFAYDRAHPPIPTREFDLGHAAHKLVLGAGPELAIIEAADWRTKAAREARDDAHAAGRVPLLPHQHEQVQAMATALNAHPIAAELLDPKTMLAEQSLFWRDQQYPETWRRARIDAVSTPDADPVLVDYKTTDAGDLDHISRALWNYGYAMQGDWYLDGAGTLKVVPDGGAQFFLIFQEKTPPYLVTVVEPDYDALRIGRQRNRLAIEIYRDCTETGMWPGHTGNDEIPLVGMPGWVERQHTTTESWEDIH